jgi:dephospho-CoA kinase
MRHRRIGVAGYMGAGKSTAARYLAEGGGSVIDADRIAKRLMQESSPIKIRLVEAFGAPVVEDGEIRFDRLGNAAFASEAALLRLNAIVHPALVKVLEDRLSEYGDRPAVLDAALLPLWYVESLFDALLWVHAPRPTRLRRIMAGRPDFDEGVAAGRMRLQERTLPEPAADSTWIRIDNGESRERLFERLGDFR